jgi:hypothetical protein
MLDERVDMAVGNLIPFPPKDKQPDRPVYSTGLRARFGRFRSLPPH